MGGLLLFCLLATGGCSSARQAHSIVHGFYSTLAHRVSHLPPRNDLQRLRPFLSARLYGLIENALACHIIIVRQPAKPFGTEPFGMGSAILKPSLDDGVSRMLGQPRRFEISSVAATNEGWHVTVTVHSWHNLDLPEWQDTLIVVSENDRFVIDDAIFAAADSSTTSRRLSTWLQFAVCELG